MNNKRKMKKKKQFGYQQPFTIWGDRPASFTNWLLSTSSLVKWIINELILIRVIAM
jgi:hypothetical protein